MSVTSWQNTPRMHDSFLLSLRAFFSCWFFYFCLWSCMVLPEQALHEALMRQEELLAYIDRQEEAKLRVSWRFCFSIYYTKFCPAPLLLTEDCVYMCVPQRRFCWWKRDSCTGGIVWWYVCTTFIYACIFLRELVLQIDFYVNKRIM